MFGLNRDHNHKIPMMLNGRMESQFKIQEQSNMMKNRELLRFNFNLTMTPNKLKALICLTTMKTSLKRVMIGRWVNIKWTFN